MWHDLADCMKPQYCFSLYVNWKWTQRYKHLQREMKTNSNSLHTHYYTSTKHPSEDLLELTNVYFMIVLLSD